MRLSDCILHVDLHVGLLFIVYFVYTEIYFDLRRVYRPSKKEQVLSDRTATQHDRLLASSCRPSVCPSVRLSARARWSCYILLFTDFVKY